MSTIAVIKLLLIIAAIAAIVVLLVFLVANGGDVRKAVADARNWFSDNFKPIIFGLLSAGLLIVFLPLLLPVGIVAATMLGVGAGGAVFLGSGGYIKQPGTTGLSVTLDRYWKNDIEYFTANNQPTGKTR